MDMERLGDESFHLDFPNTRDCNGTRFRDQSFNRFVSFSFSVDLAFQEIERGSNGRMTSKWDFGVRCEDIDVSLFVGGVWSREVEEDDFGEVEFFCYCLFLLLRQRGLIFGGQTNDGEGVSLVASCGKDIEGCEGELHFDGDE